MPLKKFFFICLLFCFYNVTSFAQAPQSYSSSEILLQLKKLKVLGSVLYIAAHPDDENTTLLTYLTKEKLFRTGYLSLTRGDGGQNLIGDEQGVDLGLIRSQELLAARKQDGAEQFFSSAFDFGYTKNPEEALTIWGHDKILSDVVWVIRNFKPDVIICRFPTTGEGGHGQHTASALLAEEAFEAAADSSQFPDQLKKINYYGEKVSTWKASRLLWNTFNFGGVNTQKEDQFKLNDGGYNTLLGKSYGEIAALSRSQHKSQGFGVAAQRGNSTEYFATIKGIRPVYDIMDSINTTWSRIGNSSMEEKVESIINHFNPSHPENSVIELCQLYQLLNSEYAPSYWRYQKLVEIKNLIQHCSAWFSEAVSTSKFITPDDSVHIAYFFNNRTGLSLDKVIIRSYDHTQVQFDSIPCNKMMVLKKDFILNDTFLNTQPYWLQNEKSSGTYNVKEPNLLNGSCGLLLNELEVSLYGVVINYPIQIIWKQVDPIKGELYQPVSVVPALSVSPVQSVLISNHSNLIQGEVAIKAFKDVLIQFIQVNGKKIVDTNLLMRKQNVIYKSIPLQEGVNEIKVFANNQLYASAVKEIHYDHIPDIIYQKKAIIQSKTIDCNIAGKNIGYIKGAGDKVPDMLQQMGYHVQYLEKKDIVLSNILKFDAIVTGVRAYNTNEWLSEVYEVLMRYIQKGGVMLVQYNTNNQIGPIKAKMSPFDFEITKNRITDENATVQILNPSNDIYHYPNHIQAQDFKDWIQERSIYHAKTSDPHFEKCFLMNDPQEKGDDGSLIIAKYGKGRFIYTGLSFFRQLPAGVPGAMRLFANLLAKKSN